MSDQEFQQTKLGHSIQESLHNKNSDSDAARLRRGHTSYSLFSLVAKFTEIEQQSRFFGTDVEIHNAEIHMIMAIHDVEGIHVTGLADRLHITKGSVSELLRKLEQKKLIHKDTDPLKLSRINIYLTEKGRIAHEHHLLYHERINGMIDQVMSHYSSEQIEFLNHFLNNVRSGLDSMGWS